MFYVNTNFNEGMITSEVFKTQIYISCQEFRELVYIPSNGTSYSSDAPSEMDNINFFIATQSLLSDQMIIHRVPLTMGYMIATSHLFL